MKNKELRIAIARDVLLQLRLKKYDATPGTYVLFDGDDDLYDRPFEDLEKMSFKDYFKKTKQATCNVCALGSCFVSLVNIKNKCSVVEMQDDARELTFERLRPIFGARNMDLMESAFECQFMSNSESDVATHVLKAAGEWGEQWDDDNERLRAIMLNIIRNDGSFKLPQRFQARAKELKEADCYW